jgi:alkylhydroperoxidase family enzyme
MMYDYLFDGRDPVAEPGTSTGSPGDWWTVFALVPDALDHAVAGFGFYQSPKRALDPVLRELAQCRAGWAAGSQFVFSQHCKSCRALGLPEEKIAAIAGWGTSDLFTPLERAVLALADALALDRGRVHDGVFATLKAHLSDEEILSLTYIIGMYVMHANITNALRLEFDDQPERIVEVEGSGDAWSGLHTT